VADGKPVGRIVVCDSTYRCYCHSRSGRREQPIMRSCRTRLQRSKSSYLQPETKYCKIAVRLLLAVTMVLSRRGSTAFLYKLNEQFHNKICQTNRVDHSVKYQRRCLISFDSNNEVVERSQEPMLLAEGLFAVDKPLDWTSNDVVSYIRGILEKDARSRGFKVDKVGKRRGTKRNTVKCGHGGTLDPLATGVLVIGVGQGTKTLQE
jgi:TruB family pseudouridylate synthase (N terminal domain)